MSRSSSGSSSSSATASSPRQHEGEFKKFIEDYTFEGTHAKDETVLNLEDNTRLKVSETEDIDVGHLGSEAVGSTRAAFKIVDLSRQKENNLRVKFIAYGNHNAMWEVISGQLYGLTGLTAPNTKFLIHKGFQTRQNGAPQVLVASPMVTGYSDLGDFLAHPMVLKFIKDRPEPAQQNVRLWQNEINAINQKSATDVITATDKLKRLELMRKIYNLLPNYFHNEIEKSFAASKFVGNWDFANLNLNNIGCRFTLDPTTKEVIKFESVFVDFGNSGAIGFGGKYKTQSLDRANTEAKKFREGTRDYDPALAFSEKEKLFILKKAEFDISNLRNSAPDQSLSSLVEIGEPKFTIDTSALEEMWQALISQNKLTSTVNLIAKELSDDEALGVRELSPIQANFRRRIIFKEVHHIRPEESQIAEIGATTGLLTFSDLPRNLPFGFLLEPALKAKTQGVADLENYIQEPAAELNLKNLAAKKQPIHLKPEAYRSSEIEIAFRLSLIPNHTIAAVVEKWNLEKDYPNIFGVQTTAEIAPRQTTEEIVDIFIKRRNALIKSIPPEIIRNWIVENRAQALTAQHDVELAILQKTGITPDFDHVFYSARQAADSDLEPSKQKIAAAEIIAEISKKEKEISDKESSQQERTLITVLREQALGLAKAHPAFIEMIQAREDELAQKQQEELLSFIQIRFQTDWKHQLGLSSQPNCNPCNLDKFREIYKAAHGFSETATEDRIMGRAESLQKNSALHQENVFVFNKIIETLHTLSDSLQHLPSTDISTTSQSTLTGKIQRTF